MNRRGTERIKWTEEMEKSLLDYAKETLQTGRQFEKPSAPDYYKKFLGKALGFENVPLDKIVQHMRNLKRSYTMALEWRGKTGQGILDNDPVNGELTVEAELLKRCKYFKELDEILGDKPQFNPPFLIHSSQAGDFDEELMGVPIVHESDILIIEDEVDQEQVNNADGISNLQNVDPLTPVTPAPAKKPRRSPIKSAASALESAMQSKILLDEKRLQWEKTMAENQKMESSQRAQDELSFKKEQLEFEREKWRTELADRKFAEERKCEIEKLKVEKEAELSRLRIEKEFELEKLKLGLREQV